jgi:hypothetical protein
MYFTVVLKDLGHYCGHRYETAHHFLFECHLFTAQRNNMLQILNSKIPVQNFTTNDLLFGIDTISTEQNESIAKIVQIFFKESKRFV